MDNEVIIGSDGSIMYIVDGSIVDRVTWERAGGTLTTDQLEEIEFAEYETEEENLAAAAELTAENEAIIESNLVARNKQEAIDKAAELAGTTTGVDYNPDGSQTYYVNNVQVDRDTYEQNGGKDAGDLTIEELEARDEQDALDTAAYEELQAEEEYARKVAEAQATAVRENDWRVRLHLGPDANYLYKATDPGILAPLNVTDGIIFPYTPQIAVQYNANYENYDLTHSNYRGYFYTGSQTQNILLTATFTANDVAEANYMLAALHFLRSATKMFYGQDDQNRGMPPPVVFLTGLGEYQFNNHPCAITMMNYNLPNDVDYIPCGKPEGVSAVVPAKVPANATASARLQGINVDVGGTGKPPESSATSQGRPDPYTKATYVPTKIEINFTMIPIQTRDQVSKEFSLKDYASGDLLKKGFW